MGKWQIRVGNPLGGGVAPSIDDHFAPTIIVGNQLAGDPAAAQAAPFQYIGDPGDGSGIATALAAAAGTGGWVHIRRGTYTISPQLLPLSIAGCIVTGQLEGTTLVGDSVARSMITMTLSGGFAPILRDMVLRPPLADVGAGGTRLIDATGAPRGELTNVRVFGPGAETDNANESLTSIFAMGSGLVLQSSRIVFGFFNTATPVYGVRLFGNGLTIDRCLFNRAADVAVGVDATVLAPGQIVIGETLFLSSSLVTSRAVQLDFGSQHAIVNNRFRGNAGGLVADQVVVQTPGVSITGNAFVDPSGVGSDGIRLEDENSVVSANVMDGHDITITAAAVDNIILGNQLQGGTLSNLGTGTEIAHNQV